MNSLIQLKPLRELVKMHVQAGPLLQSQHLMCHASRDAMMTSGKSTAQHTDIFLYYGTGCLSSTVNNCQTNKIQTYDVLYHKLLVH